MLPPQMDVVQRSEWNHFTHLLLTDGQLLDLLRKRWPDFKVERTNSEGMDAWTAAPTPARPCWLVRFHDGTNKHQIAITIEDGHEWLCYRFALYTAYVFHLSGSGS
jgi:hypothetical protein